ncbi:glycosyltransferase [Candidatus Roizmanbacteria bacterium CG_4_10_14_0_8_um_filter_39_9]|uniref:Glycosyltransferase n=1 Tax=Candidatus Roizmanbacteria bacterium CG_4_10_14_0_8_um_filter_39_9 TaxID=1974829 RepID=A0A2M7QDZ2_9BACT|nr:MAG: glycosyltransferase [Candidatus Roizmanbacteria bacterium CG_4_10_14_0_8_um_filter_39_9]
MINQGKYKILENMVSACDYEYILSKIQKAITYKRALLISPIASQTLVIAQGDKKVKKALATFDYLVPDSFWVMKSLNWLHETNLKERVYGPDLMLKTCAFAQKNSIYVFLYGTNAQTLVLLKKKLIRLFPRLKIAGTEPSQYKMLNKNDLYRLGQKINYSKPNILFVALGSPLQEVVSSQLKPLLDPLVIIPVGAAFDFISGVKKQAPRWMQKIGLEWLFRLLSEPKRLWKRYVYYGTYYALTLADQLFIARTNKPLNNAS